MEQLASFLLPCLTTRKTLEAIIQEKCSRISGTPSLYVDMITTSRDLGLKVTTLQVAIYTGAPCSKQLAMEIKETFNIKTLFPAYGLTEVAGSFISQSGDSLEKVTSTVGYVFDYVEVKVVDKNGRMVPMGTPGELWVRGFSVMLGYWKDEERTRQFITREGWAKTGDEFVLQEDGYGRILGRLKDVIIRIGDKIFPAEMEEFFTLHPDILEAQVFGIPDERVGEEICAYLRVKEGTNLTEEDVRNYCKNKIPEYKVPRYIRFVKDFERTSVGKVQKFLLLKKLQAELNNTA
ncbi:medium-chain acyl-CoA ligase ACSF2, mitochondrial-like isoform X2 [Periplaneta americana]|uniref:medium-chain acyl-CoA ligase ACSF2, mitochondrial-like isoform X2 n=1 Tax=Periplaneta americana TaxID=6978 RepID=UPI0037E94E41